MPCPFSSVSVFGVCTEGFGRDHTWQRWRENTSRRSRSKLASARFRVVFSGACCFELIGKCALSSHCHADQLPESIYETPRRVPTYLEGRDASHPSQKVEIHEPTQLHSDVRTARDRSEGRGRGAAPGRHCTGRCPPPGARSWSRTGLPTFHCRVHTTCNGSLLWDLGVKGAYLDTPVPDKP